MYLGHFTFKKSDILKVTVFSLVKPISLVQRSLACDGNLTARKDESIESN